MVNLQLTAPTNTDEYYADLREELGENPAVGELRVPDHPITSIEELAVGLDLAFTEDPDLKEYRLASVDSFLDSVPIVLTYKSISVQEYLGVDRSRSNKRTTPAWELTKDKVAISLESILVIGQIFTATMKLKSNSEKAIQTFLESRRSLERAQNPVNSQ